MKIDVHQHLWSEPLVEALARREQLPFVRRERGLTVLYLAGERPYVIDLCGEQPGRRESLIERDGLDRALLCLSSPLGVEWLPRRQARALIDAYHAGALRCAGPFGVWGALALEDPQPDDVDDALDRGCVGVSLPAGALGDPAALARMGALLARLERREAPLLIHPGPGADRGAAARAVSFQEPLWWPALTRYVAGMQAAWLAFATAGRREHPSVRVIFAMLAGLAPLQLERLTSRGGPRPSLRDPNLFYDTSSYGPSTVRSISELVGPEQILYGSDRPVLEPSEHGMLGKLDWDTAADGTRRAFAQTALA